MGVRTAERLPMPEIASAGQLSLQSKETNKPTPEELRQERFNKLCELVNSLQYGSPAQFVDAAETYFKGMGIPESDFNNGPYKEEMSLRLENERQWRHVYEVWHGLNGTSSKKVNIMAITKHNIADKKVKKSASIDVARNNGHIQVTLPMDVIARPLPDSREYTRRVYAEDIVHSAYRTNALDLFLNQPVLTFSANGNGK